MRRSSIWFIIAAFWMIDVILTWITGSLQRALPAAGVVLLFLAIGVIHRRREEATLRRPHVLPQAK